MTRTWFVVSLTLFGLVCGVCAATAWWSEPCSAGMAWAGERGEPETGTSTDATSDRTGPKVVVDREKHDFGKLDVGVTGRHRFKFSNEGDRPLILRRGRSTCGCCTCVCAVRLPDGPIAAGKSAKVTLEWTSKLYVGRFRQTATILTNDPERPELTLLVAGRFTGPVGVVPSRLQFSRVPADRPTAAEVLLYNYLKEPLRIVGHEFSDRERAECFDVVYRRLSPDQLREEPEANGGYLVSVRIKPGLPLGSFKQRIRLRTSTKSVAMVEIPVEGKVAHDVSIVGRGWNAQTGVLSMGTVNSSEGAKWSLMVLIHGPHAKQARLKAVTVVPDLLAVELGPTTYVEKTGLSLTRLTIRIPPGTKPVTHLGPGQGNPAEIVLQTNHPRHPELSILVRFAVAE